MRSRLLVMTGLWNAAVSVAVLAGDWPQFRGPNGAGVALEPTLPSEWGQALNVAWRVRIPGYGWSSPVVWGERVYVTTAVADPQKAPSRRGPGGGDPTPPNAVYRWEVHCLDAVTGETLWQRVAAERTPTTGNHVSNTYASETPVTDGERVVAYFGMAGVLACFDVSGNPVWTKELGPLRTFASWGTSSSPAIDGDRIFVQCDNEERSFVAAFDKRTGDELWRVARPERSTWSTPVVWRNRVRTELVLMGARRIRSYDPATGGVLWDLATLEESGRPLSGADLPRPELSVARPASTKGVDAAEGRRRDPPRTSLISLDFFAARESFCVARPESAMGVAFANPGHSTPIADSRRATHLVAAVGRTEPTQGVPRAKPAAGGCKSTPVATPDMIYCSMAPKVQGQSLGPIWAVRAGAAGDISLKPGERSGTHIAWYRPDAGPHFASAVVYDGLLYVFTPHGGELRCYDANTGDDVYRQRLPGAGDFKASPWACDGKIFGTDENGTTFVVAAGREFKLPGKNALDELCWASPAPARGSIFLRGVDHLYCIRSTRSAGSARTPVGAASRAALVRLGSPDLHMKRDTAHDDH